MNSNLMNLMSIFQAQNNGAIGQPQPPLMNGYPIVPNSPAINPSALAQTQANPQLPPETVAYDPQGSGLPNLANASPSKKSGMNVGSILTALLGSNFGQ